MPKKPSAALMAAIAESPPAVSEDKLETLRREVARARDIDFQVSSLEERASELKKEKLEIVTKRLPDLFMDARVKYVGVEAEGNMPAYTARLADHYSANIAADWEEERRKEAFKLMTKLGEADMIKNVVTIELGRGTSKLQRAVVAALRKLKVPFAVRRTIPHGTLSAWVKDRYRRGQPLSDQERQVLGAYVGTIVQLKQEKN